MINIHHTHLSSVWVAVYVPLPIYNFKVNSLAIWMNNCTTGLAVITGELMVDHDREGRVACQMRTMSNPVQNVPINDHNAPLISHSRLIIRHPGFVYQTTCGSLPFIALLIIYAYAQVPITISRGTLWQPTSNWKYTHNPYHTLSMLGIDPK